MKYTKSIEKKTHIEKILELSKSKRVNSQKIIEILEVYLNQNTEELTLEQYKKVRELVDQNYREFIKEGINNGQLKRSQVDYVGRLFTDYIRDQHARLLDEKKGIKIVNAIEEKPSFFNKIKSYVKQTANNITYQKDWKKIDNKIYDLERLLQEKNENPRLERELIENIPTEGLSQHKLNTLERMLPKTHYKTTLSRILNNYRIQELKNWPKYQERKVA